MSEPLKIPRMLTISQLAMECEGTGITTHFIRSLIWENKISYVMAGNKYLINFDKFIEYLNSEEKHEGTSVQPGIRTISEKQKPPK